MSNKVALEDQWPEFIMVLFLLLGFTISVLMRNAVLSYITIILAGFLSARMYYLKRYSEPIFPFIMIIVGFFIGYFIGGFPVNRLLLFIIYGISFFVFHKLFKKQIIKTFKSENFVK